MLRYSVDQSISLNLDYCMKINYGKFGDLLAEATIITSNALEVSA